eukprot:TRINITY_DN16268_c0_g1_i1.p1 TRINITY_DN16268_c0_g1~~TRINITY_DN16268_c0_g1_i1.p1  ORF type:complete len:1024 (-),score=319.26 TRINITY_DN16268_c0_g1_i1:169-3240(-)
MAEAKISPLSLLPSAATWSLAEDASLLAAMQELSFTISNQSKQLLDKMDQLAISTASAQTRLQTTTNNFMLLSNIKFIEARVYEDSEVETQSADSKVVQEETLNEEKATTQALKHGLDVIQAAFEKVEINDSDSDSDVDEEKIISVLQPKNPYHVRSLPAVIGTPSWVDDDKIGLVEEEMKEESDSSESESENDEVLPDKKEDSEYSESDTEKIHEPKKPPAVVQNVEDSDSISDFSDDDELFKPKPTLNIPESNIKVTKNQPGDDEQLNKDNDANVHSNTFTNELSSKLGLALPKSKNDTDQENGDTSGDESDHQPKPKKSVKLPPKKSVLFDSSDSDDDLFAPKPNANPPKPKANPPKHQAKKQLPENEKDPEVIPSKKLPPLPPPSKTKPNKSVSEVEQSKSPSISAVSKISDVESQSDDDFFSAISSKAPTKTKDETVKKPSTEKSLFGDSSDEDDIFSDIKVGSIKQDPNSVSKAPQQNKSLFDESDDSDDLFADLMTKTKTATSEKKNEETPQVPVSRKPFGGISMFGSTAPPMLLAKSDQDKETAVGNQSEAEDSEEGFANIVKKLTPAPAVVSEPILKIEEPIKEGSKGTLESSLEQPEKPFGGISMFGNAAPPTFSDKSDHEKQLLDDVDTDPKSDDSEDVFANVVMKTAPPPVPDAASKPNPKMDKHVIDDGTSSFESNLGENTISKLTSVVHPEEKLLPPIPPTSLKPKYKEESAEQVETIATQNMPDEGQPQSKKKPVGGVSMFGGFDPRKLMKNSPGDQDEKDGGIDSTDTTDISVDIKEPSQHSEALVTLTKSRPKMKGGRKPSTRAGRKKAIESSNAFSFDVIDGPITRTELSNVKEVIQDNSSIVMNQNQPKSPVGGVSVLGGLTPVQLIKPKTKLEGDDSETQKERGKITEVETSTENNSISFANGENSISEDIKINSSNVQPSTPVSDFDETETISFEPPPMEDVNEKLDKKNNLFGFDDSDDDDDMFSNMATSSKQTLKADPMANIFGDDSDDDLFSSLISKKS